jgi:hypothetical protein
MLTEDAMRQRMVDSAHDFAAENCVGAMTKSYMALYEDVLNRMHHAKDAEHAVGVRF